MELDSLKKNWQRINSANKSRDDFADYDISDIINSESISTLSKFRKKLKTAGIALCIASLFLAIGIIVFISEHLLLYFGIPALVGIGLFIALIYTRLIKLNELSEDKSLKVALIEKIEFFEIYYKYAKVFGSISTPFFLLTAGIISLNLSETTKSGNFAVLVVMVLAVMISLYMIFLADKDKNLEELKQLLKDLDEEISVDNK